METAVIRSFFRLMLESTDTLSRSVHDLSKTWIVVFIVLSAAPELRFGDVQLIEILQGIRFLGVIALFAAGGMKLSRTNMWTRYGAGYARLLGLIGATSLIALHLTFYPPSDISIFKQPFFLSLSRLMELSLAIYFSLAISSSLMQRGALLRTALTAYMAIGTISAVLSVVALVIYEMTGQSIYSVNDLDHRAEGFFNEGGPYGLFLTSVILVLMMRRRLFPEVCRFRHWAAFAITAFAWFLSFSKAGLLAGIVCGTIVLMFTSSIKKRVAAVLVLSVGLMAFWILFQSGLNGYWNSISRFDEAVLFRPTDRNLVMGRIVALFVVPRMIAAHPVLGIGLGNYSLMRNDPDYLQGLPAVDDWDLPGLGILSDAAEIGIPLALFLLLLVSRPFWEARRRKSFAVVLATAAFQPIALFVGVNLNFFYPWLISGFVLASLHYGPNYWPKRGGINALRTLPPE